MSGYSDIMNESSEKSNTTPLKQIRESAHLTQEQLAVYLGVAVSTVRRWESGKNEPTMTREGWKKFCQLVGKDFNELPDKLSETIN